MFLLTGLSIFPTKPRMFTAYSERQIRDFAQDRLVFIGRYPEAQRAAHRRDFAHAVSTMPPWQQILMIEGGGTNVVARCRDIDKLRGKSEIKHAVGFFMPGSHTYKVSRNKEFHSTNGIFWASDAQEDPRLILYHEQGHRIDAMLAERFFKAHSYYSSANVVWRESTIKQVRSLIAQEEAADVLVQRRESAPVSARREQLYEGYDPLVEYLQDYKREESCFHEAFAQMNEHYCMLHAQGDDSRTVDQKLRAHLPRLWPTFNTNARKYAVSLARELYAQNRGFPAPAVL